MATPIGTNIKTPHGEGVMDRYELLLHPGVIESYSVPEVESETLSEIPSEGDYRLVVMLNNPVDWPEGLDYYFF